MHQPVWRAHRRSADCGDGTAPCAAGKLWRQQLRRSARRFPGCRRLAVLRTPSFRVCSPPPHAAPGGFLACAAIAAGATHAAVLRLCAACGAVAAGAAHVTFGAVRTVAAAVAAAAVLGAGCARSAHHVAVATGARKGAARTCFAGQFAVSSRAALATALIGSATQLAVATGAARPRTDTHGSGCSAASRGWRVCVAPGVALSVGARTALHAGVASGAEGAAQSHQRRGAQDRSCQQQAVFSHHVQSFCMQRAAEPNRKK